MKQNTQFITNIAGLTAPSELQTRRQALQEVFQGNTAAELAFVLTDHDNNHPLIRQLAVIQALQAENLFGFEAAFACFLEPAKEAGMLKTAKQEAIEHRRALSQPEGVNLPIAEDEEEVDEEAEDEQPLIAAPVVAPTIMGNLLGSPLRLLRNMTASVAPGYYPHAQATVTAIEAQQRFLENLNPALRQVTDAAIQRYPGVGRNESPVKSLQNFSQFLIFLMADALQQLNVLLKDPQHEHFHNGDEYSIFIAGMKNLLAQYAQNPDYLPSSHSITALHSTQSVPQFVGSLASQDRALVVKGAPLESQTSLVGRVSSSLRRNSGDRTGLLRTEQLGRDNEELEEVVAADNAPLPQPAPNAPPEKAVFPLPAYLARSLMDKLADAIDAAAAKLSRRGSVRLDLLNAPGDDKAAKMTEIANALRAHLPVPTLREIYQIKFNEETLQTILSEKRGSYESSAFSKTLLTAGREFLAENPASLMRQYVFLTQLAAAADFNDTQNWPIHARHLTDTITKMNVLRKAMKNLYPMNGASVTYAVMKRYMWQLIDLATTHPSMATHVRVLLVAFLDTLNESQFDGHRKIKLWLLNGKNSILDLNDKTLVLKTAATNLDNDVSFKNKGIRAFERALFETNAFQQGEYVNYTSQDHQKKIESALLPVSISLNKYFTKAPQQNVSVMELQLFDTNPNYNAVATANPEGYFVGAGKSTYKTDLRLSTNLTAYWQAALGSNLSVDPIVATTLAIVNSLDGEALKEWEIALTIKAGTSAEAQVHAWIIDSLRNEIPAEGEGYGAKAFKAIWAFKDDQISLQHDGAMRLKFYRAMVEFAEILKQHLAHDKAKSNVLNPDFAKLCLIMRDCMNQTAVLFGDEATDLLKKHGLEAKYGTCEQLSVKNVPGAKQLFELETCITKFKKHLHDTCFPVLKNRMGHEINEAGDPILNGNDPIEGYAVYNENGTLNRTEAVKKSLIEVRERIYGPANSITNPNVGRAFRSAWTGMTKSESNIAPEVREQYFIDVLFTQSHHLIERAEYEKVLCGDVAYFYRTDDTLYSKWASLGTQFYGNCDGLVHLFDYYLAKNDFKKAFQIATFGFSKKSELASANILVFARKIVIAFAALTKLKEAETVKDAAESDREYLVRKDAMYKALATQSDAESIRLDAALEALSNASAIIEEQNALKDLAPVAERFDDKRVRRCYNGLCQRAAKQVLARAFLENVYSRPRPQRIVPQAPVVENHHVNVIQLAMNLDGARDHANAEELEHVAGDIKELDIFIEKITNICFDKLKRYYKKPDAPTQITIRNKEDYKLTRKTSREPLLQKCRDKIGAILATNDLSANSLKKIMQELRSEVLEGVPEDRNEALQLHEMELLKDSDFGIFQQDTILLEAFNKRVTGMSRKLHAYRNSPRSATAIVAPEVVNVPLDHEVVEPPPAIEPSPVVITDEIVLAFTEWCDKPVGPIVDNDEDVGNAPRELRHALGEDLVCITQEELDDFMPRYNRCGAAKSFERRIELLNKKRSNDCFDDVRENIRSEAEFLELNEQSDANHLPTICYGYSRIKIWGDTDPKLEDLDSVTLLMKITNETTAIVYWQNAAGKLDQREINETNEIVAIDELIKRVQASDEMVVKNLQIITEVAYFFDCQHLPTVYELNAFINELKKHIKEHPGTAAEYQTYLDDFIWAVAEKGALAEIAAAGSPSDDPNNELLTLLKDEHGFDWDYLIALGCQRYAAMSKTTRASDKGHQLLSALQYLAEPLTKMLDDKESAVIEGLLKNKDIGLAEIHTYLHGFNRSEPDIDNLSAVNQLLHNYFQDLNEKVKNNQPRRHYAAYSSIVKLRAFDPMKGNGADIYNKIYSLAQVWSKKDEPTGDTGNGFVPDADMLNQTINNVDEEPTERTPSKAQALLGRLHTLLRSDEAFAEWHREMLTVSTKLSTLIRHESLESDDLYALRQDTRSRKIPLHLNAINKDPRRWESAYGIDPVYDEQAAYQAHAMVELEQLMKMEKLANVELKVNKEGERKEHNLVIEQMGLIFLAAKHFYQDENSLIAFEKISSPFTQALLDMATARGCDADDILDHLLVKACDSFNLMLNPPLRDESKESKEDYEKSYALAITNNSALKLEMMKWIKSTPKIRKVYVEQTLRSGIQSEEQAAFVLNLLQDAKTQGRPRANSGATANLDLDAQPNAPEGLLPAQGLNVDEQALLFTVFDWHYANVNKGVPQTPFGSEHVTKRLDTFLTEQVDQRDLWQEYYAYIAQRHVQRDGATFANLASPEILNPYLMLHANKIWYALTGRDKASKAHPHGFNAHPCHDKNVLTQVMLYLVASWTKSLGLCHQNMKEKKFFVHGLLFHSLVWFNNEKLSIQGVADLIPKNFIAKRVQVPKEVSDAIDKLSTDLGVVKRGSPASVGNNTPLANNPNALHGAPVDRNVVAASVVVEEAVERLSL